MDIRAYDELLNNYEILEKSHERLLEEYDKLYSDFQELYFVSNKLLESPKDLGWRKRFIKTVVGIRNRDLIKQKKEQK